MGLAAAWGGTQLPRFGPRRLAMAGGVLFGAGYLWPPWPAVQVAAVVIRRLWRRRRGGLGLGYVTPVATVARWFPDKKGLVTGMVIMGFGFGALLMSKCSRRGFIMSGGNLVAVFAWLGVGFMAATVPLAATLRNPPADRTASATIADAAGHRWRRGGSPRLSIHPALAGVLLEYSRRTVDHQLSVTAVSEPMVCPRSGPFARGACRLRRDAHCRQFALQRRGTHVLGRRVGSPRPSADVPRDAGEPGGRVPRAAVDRPAVDLRSP